MAKERDDLKDQGKPKEGERKLSALDRAILQAIGEGISVGQDSDPAREKYPCLWEWLTRTRGGQDHVMQPAVVTLQLGPEGVLCTVMHRDLKRSVGAACLHLDDALASLEAVLSQPNPPIRSWGKEDAHLRKRRQK